MNGVEGAEEPTAGELGDCPLLEFDPSESAMIEPSAHFGADWLERPNVPPTGVACFFGDAVERIATDHGARLVTHLVAENGRNPVFEVQRHGTRVAFWQAGLGAPLAAAFLDEMIDYGCTTIVVCGGAGALDAGLALGHVVVVDEALRDEGTSFHYLAPSRTIATDRHVVVVLEQVLSDADVPHVTGRTWSTDAIYRETKGKVANRRREGCITVEMEASALLAVARFRGATLGQYLYAGDSLAGEEWDHRDWVHAHDLREQLFWLAADAAIKLAGQAS